MLPRKAIQEFKQLYRKRYGVEISDDEATFRANNLVNLYGAVYGSCLGEIRLKEKTKKTIFKNDDPIL
jgi:hypothetical protein